MCGISGWMLRPGGSRTDDDLRRLADVLHHRGPDDRGYFVDDARGLGLAHNRLSILDLSPAGHQPLAAADGRVVLVYNGELYNFEALKQDLQARGHVFVSRCDTEVVLHSYLEWGQTCFERFCGMFAVAVWDARSGELTLARDPLGMKPLYFTEAVGVQPGFYFASEIKAFRALDGFRPSLSSTALSHFMEFGYTFDAAQTAYEGVFKLPPGCRLTVRNGQAGKPQPFFKPAARPVPAAELNYDQERDGLAEVLSGVVREHLVADVPVGILLSGGLDSSLVAALAARQNRVTTISMGFEGAAFDERPAARAVATFIGSDHHEVTITPREIQESLDETVRAFDDVFDDWGTITTRLLYLKARQLGVKVVLVGEGSDEIFGGYPKFSAVSRLAGPQAWRLLRLWHMYGHRRFGRTLLPFFRVMRDFLGEAGGDWFHAVRLFEATRQLPNHYVMKVDKASMSVSVEARAPYLDRRVAEHAFRLPSDFLLRNGTNKAILRDIAASQGLLPPSACAQAKFGGSIAMDWMDKAVGFRDFARGVVLADDAPWTDALGLRGAMVDFFDRQRSGYRFPHPLSLFRVLAWRLMLINLWSRHYL